MLVLSDLHFPSGFKYSKLTVINIFFDDPFYGRIFTLVPFLKQL